MGNKFPTIFRTHRQALARQKCIQHLAVHQCHLAGRWDARVIDPLHRPKLEELQSTSDNFQSVCATPQSFMLVIPVDLGCLESEQTEAIRRTWI